MGEIISGISYVLQDIPFEYEEHLNIDMVRINSLGEKDATVFYVEKYSGKPHEEVIQGRLNEIKLLFTVLGKAILVASVISNSKTYNSIPVELLAKTKEEAIKKYYKKSIREINKTIELLKKEDNDAT